MIICRLVKMLLIIPLSSTDSERGFSIAKRIIYDYRSATSMKIIEAFWNNRINEREGREAIK